MRQRVLFVCIGNACRSQMAEAFARSYGHDVIEACSAGLSPAMIVDRNTKAVMRERALSLEDHFPKTVEEALHQPPTLIVNMSGVVLPPSLAGLPAEAWPVRDPVGEPISVHRAVRDQIEGLVMNLILRLRQRKSPGDDPTPPARRIKFGRMI
ncbi:MAG: low molecular weight phosphatase family protein [Acidobacteriota bacterium]